MHHDACGAGHETPAWSGSALSSYIHMFSRLHIKRNGGLTASYICSLGRTAQSMCGAGARTQNVRKETRQKHSVAS